ncbi:MAG TPA: PfkB family carbohydrate kinase [Acidobacteriota bacterium]|nr:PfkB family carbohydrate kinase [Acidobacteriota bacterium]
MREQLLEILSRFPGRTILVAGDLIADEFLYGRISRISREAPVLVLEYSNLVRVPGGAANAANNLLDMGCSVGIAGFLGRDEPGDSLARALRNKGADIRLLRRLKGYSTPIKTRILAGSHHSAQQQVVRVDRMDTPAAQFEISWNELKERLRSIDGIIISDYGYAAVSAELFDHLKNAAKKKNIPIVVDSRFHLSRFHGASSITPNISELESATGITIGDNAELLNMTGRRLLRRQRLDSLLVTQGRFGMTLFEPRKAPLHIPVYGTDEVADVTGAGDTVIAAFTLALSCGATPEHAARIANYAGGIVVMKRGTATTTRDELYKAITTDK